jgi:hypothetical protein
MPLEPRDNPSTPSSDFQAMIDDWTMIDDIRQGWRAIKAAGVKYLPKYDEEHDDSYKVRLESTPWRPEFVDALRNLCSKPFTKEVTLAGDTPERIKELAEDIDGKGNSLHAYAREVFTNGVANGVAGIYVTYPDIAPAPNVLAEKQSGVRPYWVELLAKNILACYTKNVNGRDVVQHIRISECTVKQDKYAEVLEERIRVIEIRPDGLPVFEVFQKKIDPNTREITWPSIQTGTISLPVIPIVLFFTGERAGNYRVKPPLSDLAHMQIEIYRALSREDEILTYAGSPMLKMMGMKPPSPQPPPQQILKGREVAYASPQAKMKIGPRVVIWCPPDNGVATNADFIQPAAANITAVSANLNDKIDHFRQLAMQPSSPQSGRLTATQAAIDAAKAHSAIEVWANGERDVLEQAFVFTCMWLKIDATISVSIHTDFGVDIEGIDEYANLIKMQQGGVLSEKTLWQEGQRRGIFGPQFDADKEKEQIAEDQQGLEVNGNPESEPATDPITGLPIDPNSTDPKRPPITQQEDQAA